MLKDIPSFDFQKALAPFQKLVELNVAKIEAAVEAQKAATKDLVALTEARVKAASGIKDADSFSAFVKEQADIAKTNATKIVEDSKVAAEEAKAYGEEVQKIITESIEEAKANLK
ncbi:MAG: phasin family protein [Gammaproteobacteria bacterium]|nr:MAG: phasin family protein [Gammaproteobacteria bacterium]RLA22160.1 MAG: phasin family protein [Gammaproteobacteria bacterium]